MKKFIISVGLVGFLVAGSGTSTFADAKNGLREIVNNLEKRILVLENNQNQAGNNEQEPLSDDVKEALLKEVQHYIHSRLYDYGTQSYRMNITDYKIVNINNAHTLQVYFEGDYDWTINFEDDKNPGAEARYFAEGLISDFLVKTKLYGVEDFNFEFYQNGERITKFQ